MEQLQMVSGSFAGLIFAAASWNMVVKAWRTKDLQSYSLGHIVLNNIGNVLYWFYVISLPIGPIWFMHAFFSLVSLIMLVWYFTYRPAGCEHLKPHPNGRVKQSQFRPSSQQERKCL